MSADDMLKVRLYDASRQPCASVDVPISPRPPRIIVWRGRFFVLASDGEFRETLPPHAPDEEPVP